MPTVSNQTLAVFLMRTMLGLVFLYAGFWKVFVLGADQHAAQFFVAAYKDSWIPGILLTVTGYAIPYFELIAGLMIVIGLRTREAVFLCGLLLLLTTYGHLLKEPLFDIDGHTFTRLALIVGWLLMPIGSDRISVDGVLAARRGA